MLQRVWARVHTWARAARTIIATDDMRIAKVARAFGAEVALGTPARSGTDRVARIAAELDSDVVVNVQADEIDVDASALENAVAALEGHDVGTVCCRLAPGEQYERDAVKVVLDSKGRALYFSREPIGEDKHMGIYACQPSFLRTYARLPRTPREIAEGLEQLRVLEHGYTIGARRLAEHYRSINRPEDLP